MLIRNGLFTSESVSEGHPDKLADQISDAIVDAFLARDPHARVACETLLSNDLVVLAGEFKSRVPGLFEQVRDGAGAIARGVIRRIGYRDAATGIDPDACEVLVKFSAQSADINQGVDRADGVLGAGDQGLMFGYACRETPALMPLPITLAHRLVQRQAKLRKSGALPWLQPDAKSQVSVRYADRHPVTVEAVVLSTQHAEGIELAEVRAIVKREIVAPVLEEAGYRVPEQVLINPTGRFVTGGPRGDTGLTGRKIIVDTYGGAAPHGGGAFSGKDPSKVDRSASYMARFLAKQVVARGWAERCLIQLSYAIGVAEPVSFVLENFDTGALATAEIERRLVAEFDLTPSGIIDRLELLRPIYETTAAYGHFGREDVALPWESSSADKQRLDSLIEFVGAEKRICPNPARWQELWDMLPNKQCRGAGWVPPLPLILAAWWDTTAVAKMLRLREHIEFAAAHGALESVDAFLRGLPEDDWHRGLS